MTEKPKPIEREESFEPIVWEASLEEIWRAMFLGKERTVSETLSFNKLEALRAAAEQLERIADSLPIPFLPVELAARIEAMPPHPDGPKQGECFVIRTPEHEQRRDENFRTALQFVRDILDSDGSIDSGRRKLFDVEALLSLELGQPIWEGRTKP